MAFKVNGVEVFSNNGALSKQSITAARDGATSDITGTDELILFDGDGGDDLMKVTVGELFENTVSDVVTTNGLQANNITTFGFNQNAGFSWEPTENADPQEQIGQVFGRQTFTNRLIVPKQTAFLPENLITSLNIASVVSLKVTTSVRVSTGQIVSDVIDFVFDGEFYKIFGSNLGDIRLARQESQTEPAYAYIERQNAALFEEDNVFLNGGTISRAARIVYNINAPGGLLDVHVLNIDLPESPASFLANAYCHTEFTIRPPVL